MPSSCENLIIITGGPGAGKTTLINLLRDAGFPAAPEAGRAIIQDQLVIGGTALPWDDTGLFAELMLCWELRSYRWAAQHDGLVFFDHALPSLPGYYHLIGRAVSGHVDAAVEHFRYRAQVFIAPPWPEIYRNDTERRQSLDEARRTYDAMVDSYISHGYHLVELPLATPQDRLQFVLRHTENRRTAIADVRPNSSTCDPAATVGHLPWLPAGG